MSRALPETPQDYDYESAKSTRSTTPTIRAQSPQLSGDSRHSRSLSRNSSDRSDRRPMGPRSPSPLPIASPPRTPVNLPTLDSELETTLVNAPFPSTPTRQVYRKTPIPRSKRQPFEPTNVLNMDTTPKASAEATEPTKPPSNIEPLSIKKRASVRTNSSVATLSAGSGSPGSAGRKAPLIRRPSPIGKSAFANASRRVSGQRTTKPLKVDDDVNLDELESRITRVAEATKADVSMATLSMAVWIVH